MRKILFLALTRLLALSNLAATPEYEELWDAHVAPLLDRQCLKCHAGVRQKGGLDLRSLDTILRGGESGPAVIPGKPAESRLFEYVQAGAETHMPPEGKKQLSTEEIESLRVWISKLPKSRVAGTCSTTNNWVTDYLADYRAAEKKRTAPAEDADPVKAIDEILRADWKERKIKPAKVADDRTFARRVYLDLIGRIPTRDEFEGFLGQENVDRRATLVDALLESPEYAKHMREVFDVILMGRPKRNNENARRQNGWNAYLEYSFRTNRPWNEMVRDMIVARAMNEPLRGASWFLYERKNNYQTMAEAVAPVAFGVQIKCAQCHNHPMAWEIEQRHYWGLVAAFNRSKNVDAKSGIGVSESAVGGFIQFANLKKESQPAVLAFLNGKVVEEKRPVENEKEADEPGLYLVAPVKEGEKPESPALPKFSRREVLADAVTHDNPRLARAFVNRMWELLMGRGIVHPVDQIDSKHRASHPILLDWLANDFETHGYDVKRLIRSIVLSRAYQLESKTPGRTPPTDSAFARALDKPLSAEQLLNSLLVATGHWSAKEEDASSHEELRKALVKTFPELMPAVYNPSLEQALFWSNSPKLGELLTPNKENTAARLLSLNSDRVRVEEAYKTVLGRAPDPDEREKLEALLMSEPGERGIKNLMWTLVASAEFQLNH